MRRHHDAYGYHTDCDLHGPGEHGLGSLFHDGLGLMAGVFWDIGEQGHPE
jgi:hypothetical protein